jgi:hypothetical protein
MRWQDTERPDHIAAPCDAIETRQLLVLRADRATVRGDTEFIPLP